MPTETARLTLYQESATDIEVRLTDADGAKPDVTGWTFSAAFGTDRVGDVVTWTNTSFTVDTAPSAYVSVTLAITDSEITVAPLTGVYRLQITANDGSDTQIILDLDADLRRNLTSP